MAEERQEEHRGLRGAADRAQDMVGGMMGRMTATGTSDTATFVEKAVIGDLYELQAARIALQRDAGAPVRAIAEKMLDDHTTASHQLRSTLRSFDDPPPVPTELDLRHRKLVEHLETAPAESFEKRYLEQQRLAHEENLALFESYAASGDDLLLCLFAQATVPSLRRHLQAVKRAEGSV